MCRIAAYAGSPVPLASLLYDPPRSLEEMAIRPREQLSGRLNVDGTGVAWFADPPGDAPDDVRVGFTPGSAPLVYRTARPPWSDPNLPDLARRIRAEVILAAVRSTTPGIPQGAAFVHPFAGDDIAATHNGFITDFRTRVARPLMAEVSDDTFASLTGMSDTDVLFLLALDARRAGADLRQAAQEATDRAAKVCEATGATATLTLVLADAGGIAAVNAAVGRPANSLYARQGFAGGTALASEPLDDDRWHPVPQGATAVLTPDTLEIHP